MFNKDRKINLQLFAEGENLEDTANLNENIDVGVDNSNVEDNTADQQPDIDTTPQNQSVDKDNPANHAFAEMRRKNKELESQLNKQREVDKTYVDLAKEYGFTNVTNAKEFAEAVKHRDTLNKYTETQDPMYLVDVIADKVTSRVSQVQQAPQETYVDNGLDREIENFNKEYKGNLKTIDDIATLPNYEKIGKYMVVGGLELKEAYALANPDKIKAASKQAAINQVRGNSHIVANNNSGNVDLIPVSANEITQWKRRHGVDRTDEQCRKELIEVKKLIMD